ncbi:hypothetical protein I551_3405 [Mycobacterium ulcerans str. Harvey]|uniref:Secreted protein n=1 Tax=Mycobacterium ulcerans str. Harvey TaxID=1299332 RepID=A0ABN0QZN5_MYCUL|nr:hypothetical protein I551_3405 [Mycobacterium ulcerans str. Harvey]
MGTSGSVRATRIAICACCAIDVHTFCPLTIQSWGRCGSRTARVAAAARAPALLISRLVSWVDDLWCRAIGAAV